MKAASARSSRASAPLQHHEARAGQPRRGLEIHQPQGFAELEMLARRIEARRRHLLGIAMAADLDIGRFVGAVRHFRRRQIGNRRQQSLDDGPLLALGLLGRRHVFLDPGDLGRCGSRRLRLAFGPQPADLLGDAIAPGLHLLQRLLQAAAILIELENRSRLGRQPTAPQPLVEGAWIIANGFQVVHLPTSRKIRVQGYRLADS